MTERSPRSVAGPEAKIDYASLPEPRNLEQSKRFAMLTIGVAALLLAAGCLLDYLSIKAYAPLVDVETSRGFASIGLARYLQVSDEVSGLATGSAICFILATIWLFVGLIQFVFLGYRNYASMGARGLRYGFHQSTWTWFIPILMLFRPKQILNDCWRMGEQRSFELNPSAWRNRRSVPGFLTVWWLLFLLVSWIDTRIFITYMGSEQQGLPSYETEVLTVGLATSVAWILILVMAIYVVKRMGAQQADAFQALQEGVGVSADSGGAAGTSWN